MNFIDFIGTNKLVPCDEGETILECALKSGTDISHSCGGNATCGTCRIIVRQGLELINPRNELEFEMAQDRGFEDNERLACQCYIMGSIRVDLPK